jgi:two-component system LytT family response regulator
MANKKVLLTKRSKLLKTPQQDEDANEILEIKRLRMENLPIPTLKGYELVDINKIFFLQADSNNTLFFFENNSSIISSKKLGFYEDALKHEAFIRVHHSSMVNLNKVARYVKADDGYLVLTNKQVVGVSRAKKEALLNIFKRLTA